MSQPAPDTTSDAILATARALFLTLGYHKTSMRAIAQTAGISTGPLYFHFANKAEIFYHICRQAHDRLLAAFLAAAAGQGHAALRLRAVFAAYWEFFHSEPELFEILHLAASPMAGIDLPADLRRKLGDLDCQSTVVMEDIIRQGIAAGEIRSFEPRSLALFLRAVAEGVFQVHRSGALGPAPGGLDAIIATAVGVIGHGIALAPDAPPPPRPGRE